MYVHASALLHNKEDANHDHADVSECAAGTAAGSESGLGCGAFLGGSSNSQYSVQT